MKKTLYLFCSFFLVQCSNLTTPINEIPMYNGYNGTEKSPEIKEIDDKFIESAIKASGTREEACIFHVKRGWSYFYENNFKTAIKRFNQAWLLDSTKSDVYFGFAAYEKLTGNETESNYYYNLAKKHDINGDGKKLYHKSLVMFLTNQKKYQAVIDFVLEYEVSDTTFKDSDAKLGYYYMELNDYLKSKQYLDKAISINPKDSISILNNGWLQYCQKNYYEAISYYTRAIEIAPHYVSAYSNRAMTFAEIKEYEKAISDNDKCLQLVKENERGQFYRVSGVIKILSGNKKDGCSDLKKALEIGDPTFDKNEFLKYVEDNCKELLEK